jgi:DNA polymerase-4
VKGVAKGVARNRQSILHVDLDPFFVSVERSLDFSLKGRPVIVGGEGSLGRVAAASLEAQQHGVRAGQGLAQARRLCPEAVFRSGDLETYARISDEVTSLLLSTSRRVERPSSDEAYVDLTPESATASNPVPAAEALKEQIQRRLGLDASLGLASSRIAARVASRGARPRGLLIVIPGYEDSFVSRQPVSVLPGIAPQQEAALLKAGLLTLGDLANADEAVLASAVGSAVAGSLRQAALGLDEAPIALAAPPSWVQEDTPIRDRRSDRLALETILKELARRAFRRLRPFGMGAGLLSVEVRRAERTLRHSEAFEVEPLREEGAPDATVQLAASLLDPPSAVLGLSVRLGRLALPGRQAPLFPGLFPGMTGASRG